MRLSELSCAIRGHDFVTELVRSETDQAYTWCRRCAGIALVPDYDEQARMRDSKVRRIG